ncbi:MAG TPA: hypothetical protein P5279_14900 [Anaerohalosphaeraceae bacterium]|jgi:uncharacterized protein with beta-barrel porin domain|nr:hypothetical protein [Anaerohalosphaeraceae bacterium]HRT51775.1 hypothetical protein [Anaerohalosphaeraceae bacterium]HRT87750.1 hypothetical protein [Anaerohalosphaeraceae bacterium]
MRQLALYKKVKDGAETQELSAGAVEALSAEAVKTLAGVGTGGAEGMTATLVANVRRAVAAELRQKEMAAGAAWVEQQVRARYPQAAAVFRRGRVIEVWLDGVPAEVE